MHSRTNYSLLLLLIISSIFPIHFFSSTNKEISSILDSIKYTAQVSSSLTSGLVAHYTFDEGSGTTANDSAGSNTVSFTGSLSWDVGKVGVGSVDLDGSALDMGLIVCKMNIELQTKRGV
jgi:hypothetical protein